MLFSRFLMLFRTDQCTHLICDMTKTPKVNSVWKSGHGTIVKSTWIQKCYESKRRVSESEYLLFDEDESSSQKSQKRKNSDEENDSQSKTKKPKKKAGCHDNSLSHM